MSKEFKNEINALIEERRNEYTEMSDIIWGYAEPRLLEEKSAPTFNKYLILNWLNNIVSLRVLICKKEITVPISEHYFVCYMC